MATAFRIHEDIENIMEQKQERKNVLVTANAHDKGKRPTFALLNNVAFDGRNAPQRSVSSHLKRRQITP